jgi:glycosyltransferase involved in cell wall biosynthesis
MKVLIDSYNNVFQNVSGGVQVRINKFKDYSKKKLFEVKLFDKWHDKVIDYDVLHIFKASFESYELCKFAKNNNIPVVISSIIPLEKKVNITFNRVLCKLLPIHTGYWYINEMLKMSDSIVVQTIREKKFVEKYYHVDKSKVSVIPNGVNIEFNEMHKPIFEEKTGIEGKYILQVGRFDSNKNQLNVIKALNDSNIPVVFIGGADTNEIEYFEECKRIAGENIHFLGWLDNNSQLLSSAYQNAEVVILPSHKEIFGNSLIEGGAAGAKLVATRELPLRDWGIDKFCKSINPNDINDINKKVKDAFYETKNDEIKAIIYAKFSWDSVIEEYLEIYNKIKKVEINVA